MAEKVLVTGGAGFIGSHVVDAMLGEGYDVVVVDNLESGGRENVSSDVEVLETDLRDPALSQVFQEHQAKICMSPSGTGQHYQVDSRAAG